MCESHCKKATNEKESEKIMAKRFKGKNKHNSHILTHRKRKQQQQKTPNKIIIMC
jgi:hypothetical protein